MSTTLAILCGLLAIPFAALGAAKIAGVEAMTARAAHLGYSTGAYRAIGLAEVAAVVGLLSAHWAPALATAALLGLVALMVGALVSHLRNGDGPDHFTPAVVMLVVTAALGVAVVVS